MKKATLLYCSTKLPSMKKLLLTIFTVIAFLSIVPTGLTSCTKENPTHDTLTIVHNDTTVIRDTIVGIDTSLASSIYYVKLSINGANVEYRYNTSADYTNPNVLLIGGKGNLPTAFPDQIQIELFSGAGQPAVGLGVYAINTSPNLAFITVWQSGRGYSDIPYQNDNSLLPSSCTITAIDNVSISGTFSGTLYFGNAAPLTITNGSFNVPF
jgi:hypothetical protein